MPPKHPPKLRLFLDEGVPDSVGKVFSDAGHKVIYLRDAIAPSSPDVLVCAAAESNNAILVALDGDMKEIAKGHGLGGGRFKRLSLVKLSCPEPMAANRVKFALSLIEHEWLISGEKSARRLFIEIGTQVIKTFR